MQRLSILKEMPSPAADVRPVTVGDEEQRSAMIVRAKRTYQALVVPHRKRSTFAETLAEIA